MLCTQTINFFSRMIQKNVFFLLPMAQLNILSFKKKIQKGNSLRQQLVVVQMLFRFFVQLILVLF